LWKEEVSFQCILWMYDFGINCQTMDAQVYVDIPSYFWLICLFCEASAPTSILKWTKICLKSSQANSTSKNLILITNYGQFSSTTPTPLLKWARICLKSSQISNTNENLILIINYGWFPFAISFKSTNTSSLGLGKMTLWLRRMYGKVTWPLDSLVFVWYVALVSSISSCWY
jgi:hypothetical protein